MLLHPTLTQGKSGSQSLRKTHAPVKSMLHETILLGQEPLPGHQVEILWAPQLNRMTDEVIPLGNGRKQPPFPLSIAMDVHPLCYVCTGRFLGSWSYPHAHCLRE
jgi:hypothetical protein